MILPKRAGREALTRVGIAIRLHGERRTGDAARVRVKALARASALVALCMKAIGSRAAGQKENEKHESHLYLPVAAYNGVA